MTQKICFDCFHKLFPDKPIRKVTLGRQCVVCKAQTDRTEQMIPVEAEDIPLVKQIAQVPRRVLHRTERHADPQSGQGPKTVKAGTRTLYRREDVEQWLAEVDRRSEPLGGRKNARSEPTPGEASGWYEKAVEAAGRIAPAHTPTWKLASTYALLSIAESLLTQQQTGSQVRTQRDS